MRSVRRVVLGALAVLAVTGCLPPDDGGGGVFGFTRGFVFVRPSDGNVHAADESDLTEAVALTTSGGCREPSLSPDGEEAVYLYDTPSGDTELRRVGTGEGLTPETVLRRSGTTFTAIRHPVVSPDGAHIAFAFERGASSGLATVDIDGADLTELVVGGASYAAPSYYRSGAQ